MHSKKAQDQHSRIDVLVLQEASADQRDLLNCFKEYDVSFKVSTNDAEVLQNLTESPFKLIMIDLALLENSGFSLVHKIYAHIDLNIPVVAIIPHHAEALQSQCFEAGVSGCFTSPISKIEVVGILTQFLYDETLPQQTKSNEAGYEAIDLTYLKEVSMGDVDL